MRRHMLLALLAFGLIAGCNQAPPEPPPEEEPPPPSAEQIHRELSSAFGLFSQLANQVGDGLKSEAERDQIINNVRQISSKYRSTPHGPEGIDLARRDLEKVIRKIDDSKGRYPLLKACIMTHHVLAPTSDKYAKLEPRVDLMLARPRVILRGFMEVDKENNAFMDVIDRDTKKKTVYTLREGEDFHDVLRLVRIIGNNQAIEVLYKPVDESWIVKKPGDYLREVEE